jgi:hypothetical protein
MYLGSSTKDLCEKSNGEADVLVNGATLGLKSRTSEALILFGPISGRSVPYLSSP